jgi:predicted small metal-binding protein
MNRRVVDCRAFPNEVGCTLTIAGQEEEVLTAAVQHAISVHGHTEPIEELRSALRAVLQDEQLTATR